MQSRHAGLVEDLRSRIAWIGKSRIHKVQEGIVPFGVPAIDVALPEHGLACGALHEMAGAGPDIEHGCAAALLAAGMLGRGRGTVLWVVERPGLFAPALSQVGLHPDRVIFAQAGRPDGVLLAMEEGLRHRGLGGVVGELGGRLALTHSRRLQLAAEASGVMAIVLRRSRRHDDPALSQPSAAITRWRVGMLPSPPPLPHAPDTPGLARARWRLELMRCRGGQPSSWIVEACDAKGRLRLVAELAHGSSAPAPRRRAAPGPAAGDVAA
jgi:protein ImuA